MRGFQQKKQGFSISQCLATFFSVGMCLYFAYHLMHGDRGYFALKGVQEKLVITQKKYEQKISERIALENRVKRMRPNSLDLDMLDERARVVLGFVKPDERLILIGQN
jgi:cell division protein FtsB